MNVYGILNVLSAFQLVVIGFATHLLINGNDEFCFKLPSESQLNCYPMRPEAGSFSLTDFVPFYAKRHRLTSAISIVWATSTMKSMLLLQAVCVFGYLLVRTFDDRRTTPNRLAVALQCFAASLSMFLINEYQGSDWNDFWATQGLRDPTSRVDHASIRMTTLALLASQTATFVISWADLSRQRFAGWS